MDKRIFLFNITNVIGGLAILYESRKKATKNRLWEKATNREGMKDHERNTAKEE